MMDTLTKGKTSREMISGAALLGIDSLPDEVLIEIFSYLPLGDLAWCSHTCRRWHNVLREKKSLWRHKQCITFGTANIKEVLAVAGAMPQLKTLYLLYCGTFGIHVAWPEATVFHYYGDAPLTWEPYFECFDTESLVVDHSMQNNIFFYLSWVDSRTLRRIFVLEQSYFSSPYTHTHMPAEPICRVASASVDSKAETSSVVRQTCHMRGDPVSSCTNSEPVDKLLLVAAHESEAVDSSEEESMCPALEEVNVYSKYIWDQHLENLCSLGPLRALHVQCQRLHSLTFVRCCCKTLEKLVIKDCRCLLEDAFAELCCLESLRVLHLSNCRVEEWTIRGYVAELPCLESFLLNGHKVL